MFQQMWRSWSMTPAPPAGRESGAEGAASQPASSRSSLIAGYTSSQAPPSEGEELTAQAPRAKPEEVSRGGEGDEAAERAAAQEALMTGADQEERVSIRAPLSAVEDDEEEEEEEGEGMEGLEEEDEEEEEEDFLSTADKNDSVSSHSYGSQQSQGISVPVAKVTPEQEDFNLPARVGAQAEGSPPVPAAAAPVDGVLENGESPPAPAPVPATPAASGGAGGERAAEAVEVETIDEANGEWGEEEEEDEEDEEEDEDEDDGEGEGGEGGMNSARAQFEEFMQGLMQGQGPRGAPGSAPGGAPGAAPGSRAASGLGMPNGSAGGAGANGAPSLPQRGEGRGPPQGAPRSVESILEALARSQGQALAGAGGGGSGGAVAAPAEEETEMGRKLTELKVKLLRFLKRTGQTDITPMVSQVFYRLDLAERLQRQTRTGFMGQPAASRNDRVKALAEELEASEGSNTPLGLEVTVMLLGRVGVGKTATVHSLLGIPFGAADAKPTTRVKETVGDVHGVTFKMIEVPGLHPSSAAISRNLRTMRAAKKFLGKRQPDVVLYVDRLDWHGKDFGDLDLVRPITEVFGNAVWVSTVGLLTHAAASPPEDEAGRVMSYEIYTGHRTHAIQTTMRHAAGDARLTNPVVLAENHPMCRTNRLGDKILPNGQVWRPHLLLTCLAGRCLADGNELLQKGGGAAPQRPGPMRQRMPPLAFLVSNLLQKRAPVKLPQEQGLGDDDDDDADEDAEAGEDDVDFDQLPPFRRLNKAELAQLNPAQRKEYRDELAEREKLFQKKQWKEEQLRRREMRKLVEEEERRAKEAAKEAKAGGDKGAPAPAPPPAAGAAEEEEGPSNVPVPSPEMDIPLSFDSDHPTHRYRHLPSESEWMLRPVSELNGWDHDVGFNTFQVEKASALFNSKRLPAYFNAQVEKDKKDCAVQLEAGTSVRHGSTYPGATPVTTLSLDCQLAGKDHRMGTVRADTKLGLLPHNKLGLGLSVTKYPDMNLIPGIKIEDSQRFGKRLSAVAAAGMVKYGRHSARGLNIEAQLRPSDYPIGRNLHQAGLSVLDFQGDLVVGANVTSQLQMGNSTSVVLRGNINNRSAGTISVRCSSSEHMQLALVGAIPLLRYILGGGFLWRRRGEEGEGEQWQG